MTRSAACSLLLLPLLAACRTHTVAHVSWNDLAEHGLLEVTKSDRMELRCRPDAVHVEVTLEAHVDAGTLDVRLTDPRGRERWSGRAGGGPHRMHARLEPMTGTWLLEMDLRGFSGGYSAELRAESDPPPSAYLPTIEITDVRVESEDGERSERSEGSGGSDRSGADR